MKVAPVPRGSCSQALLPGFERLRGIPPRAILQLMWVVKSKDTLDEIEWVDGGLLQNIG